MSKAKLKFVVGDKGRGRRGVTDPEEPESGPNQTVTILGLGDPEDDPWVDEMYGLLCQAKLKSRVIEIPLAECAAKQGSPNRQLLKDYSYWFWNWR